jgi:hypothetical protein
MCGFTGCKGNKYVYATDGSQCEMDSRYLKVLFRTHGYCVNPQTRDGSVLPAAQVHELKNLALQNGDVAMATLVENFSTPKVHNSMMNETTVNEKHRFSALDHIDQSQTYSVLMTILKVGMYLAGWKGPSEPYPSRIKVVSDVVRMDLAIDVLIRSLHSDQHFAVVKNFPIVSYNSGMCPSKPSKPCVSTVTLDECLNTVTVDTHRNYQSLSTDLIVTAYYYLTTICGMPVPMVQPLIQSLTQVF